jgi:hypothetical protein
MSEVTPEKPTTKSKEKVTLDSNKNYNFKSNGKCKHMPKDEVYEVTAELAEIFITNKYGEII